MTRPKANEMLAALTAYKRAFFNIGLFSAVINLLMLAPALYMLQVYDRVLASGNQMTLLMLTLMILGPTIWVSILHHEKAIFPYEYPALFSMAVAFVGIWFFSITDKSAAADEERARFFPQFIRSQTGLGASGAVAH